MADPTTKSLNDATAFRYFFLLRSQLSDALEKRDFSEDVWSLVDLAWRWLQRHARLKLKAPPMPPKVAGRRESQRLAGTPWLASVNGSMEILLESRAILDSAYLQLGVWQHGQADRTHLQVLQQTLDDFIALPELLEKIGIGRIDCIYAEVVDLEQATHIAREILKAQQPEAEEFSICTLPWGCLATIAGGISPVVVLALHDSNHIDSASWVVNLLLPRLSLAYLKIEHEFRRYELEQPQIETAERALAANLEGRVSGGSLTDLEKNILLLSQAQDRLVEKLSKLTQRLIGMEANRRNIEMLLREPILSPQYQTLWQVFAEPASLAIEQIKVDMNYFQARKDEGQLAAQTLRAFIDVEGTRTDRLMVAILGVVGLVLSLIDGFADVFSVTSRAIILGLGTVAGLAIWFLGKRKQVRN